MKVYLAGKITKNGWREKIVEGLRSVANSEDDIYHTLLRPQETYIPGLLCTGPFFIGCDHGCYHGEGTHGVGADGRGCSGGGVPPHIVTRICRKQIANCDFLFAFIDAADCFGTLCEIGYAVATGTPVVVMYSNNSFSKKMWFVSELADVVFSKDCSVEKANIDAKTFQYASEIARRLSEMR